MIKTQRLTITTDSGGAAVVATTPFVGLLEGFIYIPGASGLDTGADLAIIDPVTGVSLLAITNAGVSTLHKLVRVPIVDALNAASLFASGGEPVEDRYLIVGGVQITVAQGGNAKTGHLYVVYQK